MLRPFGRRWLGALVAGGPLLLILVCVVGYAGYAYYNRAPEDFQAVRPVTSVKEFDDVRWKDMSKLDLSDRPGLAATLRYNQRTAWPPPARMPGGCDPNRLLADAMNPGLGVRDLHREGITGRGVNVAIIDQPMYLDHPEFEGKIAAYHDVGCGSTSSMHGPAVASLLVGVNCGTAPDARVYYVAAPSWTADTAYQAEALDWVIEQNASLPASNKIRVVSISAAPSGNSSPFKKNREMWDEAYTRAEKASILVLDCTTHHGFIGSCWYDASDPENVANCTPGFPGKPASQAASDKLLAPTSPRTTAEEYDKGDHRYQYCGRGGLSWAIPYCAGVLALGWQVRPDIPPQQMRDLLFESAYTTDNGAKIINPKEFISHVRKAKVEP
jgi:serine protease AprX